MTLWNTGGEHLISTVVNTGPVGVIRSRIDIRG